MSESRIVVLTTGGTIASEPGASGRSRSGAIAGDALLARAGLTERHRSRVDVESVLQKPSNAITLADLITLHRRCAELAKTDDVEGIVITHGTDTLEDTAYFLDITLAPGPTVVITGSQRAPHQAGTDAFGNIADAIQVAASPAARGLGTLVVFNQTIFSARHVRKVSTYQLHGFAAPTTGPLGYVDGDEVRIFNRPVSPASLPLKTTGALPRVDIVTAYLDAAPDLLRASIVSGARGIVIEGLGRGHVPPNWVEAVAEASRDGIAVGIVSGCLAGAVHQSYEFVGSLSSLEQAGAFPIIDLSSRKARLLLSVILADPGTADVRASLRAVAV